jgi:glyoxylase-like metal-dependent hydrolase (beta-lactamase superfamily II)
MINIKDISARTRILTFDDGLSIVLILGERFIFLCDTHLGPESMDIVKEYLKNKQVSKKLIVFNSHSDWDHIWGNCAFSDALIMSHISCRKRIIERGLFDLNRLSSLTRGEVTISLPVMTFEDRVCFNDEEVEFIHAPGHTIDSSICFDRKDGVLYIGDLVEDPIPYLDYEELDIYIKTLEMLIDFPSDIMVSGHSGVITRDIIRSNIRYIRMVRDGLPVDTEMLGSYESVHQININTLLMFKYEKIAKEILSDRFNFNFFWSVVPDLAIVSTDELNKIMQKEMIRYSTQYPGESAAPAQ